MSSTNYLRSYESRKSKQNSFFKKIKLKFFGVPDLPQYFFQWIQTKYFAHNKNIKYICDLGCGRCTFFPHDYKNYQDWVFHGLDIGNNLEEQLAQRDIKLFLGDLNKEIPLNKNKYDVIICSNLIEHLNQPENLIRNIYEILSPGGIALVLTPDIKTWGYRFYNDYTHVRPYTLKSLSTIFNVFGFEVLYAESNNIYQSIVKKYHETKKSFLSFLMFSFFFLIKKIINRNTDIEILVKKPYQN